MTHDEARAALADHIDPAEPLDAVTLAAIAQDVHRARREFTLEEYPEETHAARIAAVSFLQTNPTP